MRRFLFRKVARPAGAFNDALIYYRNGRRPVTVGTAKAERLRVKNERRAVHGLPPIADYASI